MIIENMQGIHWLAIDVANNYGYFNGERLDKQSYQTRIDWVKDNLEDLEDLANTAKNPYGFIKAVMALRDAMTGKPVNHPVGVDASSSGMQIMSAITRCQTGCENTGVIGEDRPADAYAMATKVYNEITGESNQFPQEDIKQAVMSAFYGSTATPKALLGEDLTNFFKMQSMIAPGAWSLLQVLLDSWDPTALYHSWFMPDGHYVYCPVMVSKKTEIHVPELDASVTMYSKENGTSDYGKANAANVVHSLDAYVMRQVIRRCSYDAEITEKVLGIVTSELIRRELGGDVYPEILAGVQDDLDRYSRNGMLDPVVIYRINSSNAKGLPTEYLDKLHNLLTHMLAYPSFQILTVHDDFRCLPNHVSRVIMTYREVLAELSDSTVLEDILKQLGVHNVTVFGNSISNKIRQSQYPLT